MGTRAAVIYREGKLRMDMTIEEYLEFQNHLLQQAEEDGFMIDSVEDEQDQ